MKKEISLLRIGTSQRMERVLDYALQDLSVKEISPESLRQGSLESSGKKILFSVYVDDYGISEELLRFLRFLRSHPGCLDGCYGAIHVDGAGELYTKKAAQMLALAANMAGCAFPGKPLVEGTGSLHNQLIMSKRLGMSFEETYFWRLKTLVQRLMDFSLPKFEKPKLLVLYASEKEKSNTMWLGGEVLKRLPEDFQIKKISLRNGEIYDCRGCSYETCRHFAENSMCFYGGSISKEVLPAISACNALLFLCPNYNDAVSANITALFNRMTSLLVRQDLYDKYLFGIVVSGYSGSDLVAGQLLNSMCLNKTAMLPPRFCMMETANDPGEICGVSGIEERLDAFSKNISSILLS